MDTAAETLLIVVSSVLSIFLIFAIIALVYFIKLIKQTRRIADHVETTVESVEAAANTIERSASPLAFLKIVGSIVEQATKARRK